MSDIELKPETEDIKHELVGIWRGSAGEIQCLDPSRSVEELAYENIHFRESMEASKDKPYLDRFVEDYVRSRISGLGETPKEAAFA